jgi:sugar lactone lactonase YvrE
LLFDGDPAGLWWDYGIGGGLYIADQGNNRIAKWTDAAGFVPAASLPGQADAGGALGQLVRLLDGRLIVTRPGAGTQGGVLVVSATGVASTVSAPDAGLKPTRQRVGLTFLPDNTLVDTYFVETDAGSSGALATLALTASEKDLLTGLTKPIGVVHSEGNLFVSDQALGAILKIGKAGGVYVTGDGGDAEAGSADAAKADSGDAAAVARAAVFAAIDRPGYLCQGPDGSLFVASLTGTVMQVSRAGVVSVVASGLKEPRGVAFDGAARRLFVADHDPAAAAQQSIRIYPIP